MPIHNNMEIIWTKKYKSPAVKMETDGNLWGRFEWNVSGRVHLKWGATLGTAKTIEEATALVAAYLKEHHV